MRSADQAASEAAAPPRSVVTVAVEERVLSSTVVTRGSVMPSVSSVVSGPTTTGGVVGAVTGVFVKVGDQVAEGARVVEVAGRPVFVLQGEVPVYRSMRPGMVGADIRELQAALTRTGCAAGSSGVFDEATKSCVQALYESLGYQVIRSADNEATLLVEAEATVSDAQDALANAKDTLAKKQAGPTAADRLAASQALEAANRDLVTKQAAVQKAGGASVDKVDAAIAALNGVLVKSATDVAARSAAMTGLQTALADVTPGGQTAQYEYLAAKEAVDKAKAAFDAMNGPPDVIVEQRAVDQAAARLDRAKEAYATAQASAGPTVPFGEVVFVPKTPARVDSLSAVVGAVVGAGSSGDQSGNASSGASASRGLMVLSSSGLEVRLTIQPGDVGLLRAGMPVELLDEAAGVRLPATLTSVAATPSADPSGGVGGTYAAVANGVQPLPDDWSGKDVRVTITAASTSGKVLVVPLAAVTSASDGSTRVQVQQADGTLRLVPVDVGVSADGFLEVRPVGDATLTAGDRVVVSS